MNGSLLAVDLGTAGLRALLVDVEGAATETVAVGYPTHHPHPGWAEQDPRDWWRALLEATDRLSRSHPALMEAVAGVAITGQSPGVVLVDAAGAAQGPAIIWRDRRAMAEARYLASQASPAQWLAWTGFAQGSDAGLRPAKLRWLAENAPDRVASARWLLQPKDYLVFRLTGRAVIDTSSMNGSGLSHAPGGVWDLVGFPTNKLPEPVDPTDVAGTVIAGEVPGPLTGVAVIPTTFDGKCGVLGSGLRGDGEAINVAGTSQIVAVTTATRCGGEGLTAMQLAEHLWTLGGPTQSGGGSVTRAMGQFGFSRWEDLEAAARAAPAGSDGLIFLPFLEGERTPHWDSDLRGGLVGLSARHGREHVARAILEAGAYVVADIVDRAGTAAGGSIRVARCSGGMARSALAVRARADLLGVPLTRPEVIDASALGAAALGAVGLGWFPDVIAAVRAMVRSREPVEPEVGLDRAGMLQRYRDAVGAARGFGAARRT